MFNHAPDTACPSVLEVDEDLARENAFLKDVLRSLPVGLIVVDDDDRILLTNGLADSIRGVGDRIGHSLAECHPSRSQAALAKVLERLRDGRYDAAHPLVVDRGNGWQTLYSAVRDRQGTYRGSVWVALDVRRQKALQDQVLHQERIASLGRMSARLAHEVKNAVNTVSGALHNLRRSAAPVAIDVEMIDIIDGQVERLQDLVDQLRQVAKPLSANREHCGLASLARRAVRDTVCEYAGQVHIEVPPNDVRVSVDPELVLRFLNNVLANATWAAGADGEVTLRARVEVDPHGEWVVIEVEDSGPGFAPAVLDHLFEPFVTTRADGTGLGLITMREVCRLHGGDLSVTNRPQGGALVTARMLSR